MAKPVGFFSCRTLPTDQADAQMARRIDDRASTNTYRNMFASPNANNLTSTRILDPWVDPPERSVRVSEDARLIAHHFLKTSAVHDEQAVLFGG
jgi:hypothetical protein